MSSNDAEFVEKSDRARFRTPYSITHNGGAFRVRPHEQFSDIAPALVSKGNPKKG
jgi:hypothetical protein